MFNDSGNMPIAGSALVAALLYAGVSAFGTGPMIGERTIEKSNWHPRCVAGVKASAKANDPAAPRIPKLGCMDLFGGWLGAAGSDYCRMHGHLFENNPINRLTDGVHDQKERLRQGRLDAATRNAASRCDCAVTYTLENKRVSFALYAGSLRLITPPAIKGLDAELQSALAAPHCAQKS